MTCTLLLIPILKRSSRFSIRSLSGVIFENLNSLETLNLQNNKLMHVPEDVIEPILDTLRVVDIMGEYKAVIHFYDISL